jgi:hypothetical protein
MPAFEFSDSAPFPEMRAFAFSDSTLPPSTGPTTAHQANLGNGDNTTKHSYAPTHTDDKPPLKGPTTSVGHRQPAHQPHSSKQQTDET